MHRPRTPDEQRVEAATRGLLGGIGRLSRMVERKRCAADRRATEAHITPLGRELLERARQRMASALLAALRENADDAEHAVSVAREAVRTLLNACEPEAT